MTLMTNRIRARRHFGGVPSALAAVFAIVASSAFAQTPEERGIEIATEARARNTGWKNISAYVVMVLRNSRGDESIRFPRSRSLEQLDSANR